MQKIIWHKGLIELYKSNMPEIQNTAEIFPEAKWPSLPA